MAARQGGKFFSVIFTTIVAPITVSLAIKNLGVDGEPGQEKSGPSRLTVTSPSLPELVVVEGVGATPEEALRHALRTALRDTLSSMLTPDVHARQLVIDTVLLDGEDLILNHRDVSFAETRQQGRKLCRRTVSVRLSTSALAERVSAVVASLRPRSGPE